MNNLQKGESSHWSFLFKTDHLLFKNSSQQSSYTMHHAKTGKNYSLKLVTVDIRYI